MRQPYKDFGRAVTVIRTDDSAVGSWVNGYRRRRLLTLRQIAERTGLSISYISELEHGRRKWSALKYERICAAIEAD